MELRASAWLMTPYLVRLTNAGRCPEPEEHNVRGGVVAISSLVLGARQSDVHDDPTHVNAAEEKARRWGQGGGQHDRIQCTVETIRYVPRNAERQPTNPVRSLVPWSTWTPFSHALGTHIHDSPGGQRGNDRSHTARIGPRFNPVSQTRPDGGNPESCGHHGLRRS